MTVSNSSNKSGPYVGDGVTTVFPRTFKIISESHLVVYFVVSGVDSVQSSGFTVDGVGAETGNVTFQTAPPVGTSVLLSVPFRSCRKPIMSAKVLLTRSKSKQI